MRSAGVVDRIVLMTAILVSPRARSRINPVCGPGREVSFGIPGEGGGVDPAGMSPAARRNGAAGPFPVRLGGAAGSRALISHSADATFRVGGVHPQQRTRQGNKPNKSSTALLPGSLRRPAGSPRNEMHLPLPSLPPKAADFRGITAPV